ncbi:MAG: radical SAM protein [Deltaproteobacteria bacterium]|nr:radical SAM protein [Deltaproteobacteria bacterium]
MDPKAALRVLAIRSSLSKPAPVSLGYELTHRCNLDCKYCDRHTPLPDEMEHDDIFSALAGMLRIGMRSLSLDGGEPLLHPDVAEIVEWLVNRRIEVRMNSNGLLVPTRLEVVRYLSKLKISVDGPRAVNDSVRGKHAWNRAIEGAIAARDLGVQVELTCVVGRHNASTVTSLVELVAQLGFGVIFQPARDSLFVGHHDRVSYALDNLEVRHAFDRIEYLKMRGAPVLNGWSSLRHFRRFPLDTPVPCAAGWINATMDPAGNLYACGLHSRLNRSNNVVRLGVETAFQRLHRRGCQQCWCARVVEENFAWGGRFDQMLPLVPMREHSDSFPPALPCTAP